MYPGNWGILWGCRKNFYIPNMYKDSANYSKKISFVPRFLKKCTLYTNLVITTNLIGKTVKLDKIYWNYSYFCNGSPNYTNSNIEKLQWHFEAQLNYYAVYSKPVEKIANSFAVCKLKNFCIEKYKKKCAWKINIFLFLTVFVTI